MLFTVLAPNTAGIAPPVSAIILRILVCSVYFGVFGGLVGLGVGLLATGIAQRFK